MYMQVYVSASLVTLVSFRLIYISYAFKIKSIIHGISAIQQNAWKVRRQVCV